MKSCLFMLMIALCAPALPAQDSTTPAEVPDINKFEPGHWRTSARDIRAQVDTVPAPIRLQRNKEMASFIVPPGGEGVTISNDHAYDDFPKYRPKDIYLIATSVNTLLLSATRDDDPQHPIVYSEMRFRADKIIQNASPSSDLVNGGFFDVDFSGGSLTDAAGHRISSPLEAVRFNPLPNRQYLMMVHRYSDTSYGIFFCWEIVNSHLVANGSIDLSKIRTGRHSLQQLSLDEAIQRIRDHIHEEMGK